MGVLQAQIPTSKVYRRRPEIKTRAGLYSVAASVSAALGIQRIVLWYLEKREAHCGIEGSGVLISRGRMDCWSRILSILVASLWSAVLPANAQVNVTQEHNNPSRDGVYIDAAFTLSAAANLTRDLGFDGTISGNVYAQPLYVEGGPNGPMIIAVTESNNVYALDAVTGTIIWQRNVGLPVT